MEQVVAGRSDRPTFIEVYEPSQHLEHAEQIIDGFVVGAGEKVTYKFPTATAGYRMKEPTGQQLEEYATQTNDRLVQAQLEGRDFSDPKVRASVTDPETGAPLVGNDGRPLLRTPIATARHAQPEYVHPLTMEEMGAGKDRAGEFQDVYNEQEERLNATPPELRKIEPRTPRGLSPAAVARGSGGTGEPVGDIPQPAASTRPVQTAADRPTPASQPGNPPQDGDKPLKPNPQTSGEEGEQNPQGEDAAGRKAGSQSGEKQSGTKKK